MYYATYELTCIVLVTFVNEALNVLIYCLCLKVKLSKLNFISWLYIFQTFSFGSKCRGARTGIIFNNEMDDFSTPGTNNSFGVPSSPANYIEPGKRPLSAMTPTIVLDKDGRAILSTGGSGGSRITTAASWVRILPLLSVFSSETLIKCKLVLTFFRRTCNIRAKLQN